MFDISKKKSKKKISRISLIAYTFFKRQTKFEAIKRIESNKREHSTVL